MYDSDTAIQTSGDKDWTGPDPDTLKRRGARRFSLEKGGGAWILFAIFANDKFSNEMGCQPLHSS